MTQPSPDTIRENVRARYGRIAQEGTSCCGPSCCTPGAQEDAPGAAPPAALLGYTAADEAAVPAGANLGLGCGNPQAIADLRPGEVVLDLGAGAGFDALLAARAVGPNGRVIGVDMTAEMVARARRNAATAGLAQVEFRLGEIEHLPVADATVDVVMSNCVVNLSPDKAAVFREAFRVLRPGGRVAIADVVARAPLAPEVQADLALVVGCLGGAATVAEVEGWMAAAGFTGIRVKEKPGYREIAEAWAPGHPAIDLVFSATIEGTRP